MKLNILVLVINFILFIISSSVLTNKPNTVVGDPFGSHGRINAIRGEPFLINCCWTKGDMLSFFDRIITEEGDESAWAQEYNRLYQTGAQCARLDIGKPGDRDKGRYECRTFKSKKPKEYVVFLKCRSLYIIKFFYF